MQLRETRPDAKREAALKALMDEGGEKERMAAARKKKTKNQTKTRNKTKREVHGCASALIPAPSDVSASSSSPRQLPPALRQSET